MLRRAVSQLGILVDLLRSKVAAASLQVQVTSDNAAHKYPIRVLVPYELVAVGMIVACWCALSSTAKCPNKSQRKMMTVPYQQSFAPPIFALVQLIFLVYN